MATPRRSNRALSLDHYLELSQELVLWASRHGLTNDPTTKLIVTALTTGEGLAELGEVTMIDTLPLPMVQRSARRMRFVSTITIFRNVLVFVPVALTWLAVSKSTSAFAAYTSVNKNSVVNFLEFWQNGYGFLSNSWTIGHVAFLDFLIIAAIILITLYGSFVTRREDRLVNFEMDAIEREHTYLATRIQLALAQDKKLTVPAFNASTNAALRNLNQAAKALTKAAKDLEKANRVREKSETKKSKSVLGKFNISDFNLDDFSQSSSGKK
jgi:hypothetical protein